ncbi:MAG TPA: addiction module protein [Thermoanaerobaculia bacterium]|nr:addiction module protein [Thermoanaerobaculia bacterium]
MNATALKQVMDLSVLERLELVQALWDSIAARPEALPLSDRDRRLLDERLAAYREDPEAGSSWEEAVESIRRPR